MLLDGMWPDSLISFAHDFPCFLMPGFEALERYHSLSSTAGVTLSREYKMGGRLLCQKLPSTFIPRPPALMTCSPFFPRKTSASSGNIFCSRTKKVQFAQFATAQAATGNDGGRIDEARSQTIPVAGVGGSGGDSKGGVEVARRRDAEAPARRSRSKDAFSSLSPLGVFDFWDPFTTTSRNLRQMIETMEHLFGDVIQRTPWDVIETDDAYTLRVDMPGLSKEEVKIYMEDNELVISGEHKSDDEGSYAVYSTRVLLPKDAQLDQIKAEFRNGVLNVVVPKVKSDKKDVKEIPVS
ncbi:hypothetical protein O6H91_03G026400 [Diphasiastrum complanatum]|uniref:Uncharacterized protein n=4 Tax=Diphasiastrum complanatum TaxID=34168 RepID=A0ACC2E4F4_DIPCM|nr:hypothetical protein O6H91_03G026400 [Diphasiastrum complanatum]